MPVRTSHQASDVFLHGAPVELGVAGDGFVILLASYSTLQQPASKACASKVPASMPATSRHRRPAEAERAVDGSLGETALPGRW
jgi:hypothetical protein